MTIVCGTDLSETSQAGVRAAAAFAGLLGQDLWLVHVLDPTLEILGPAAVDPTERAMRERLSQEADLLRVRHPQVRVAHEVLRGRAYDALPAFVETRDASLLIVASGG